MKAQPHKQRKYTKAYIKAQQDAKRARFDAVMEKAQDRISNKKTRPTDTKRNVGFTVPEEKEEAKKSFLKGNAH